MITAQFRSMGCEIVVGGAIPRELDDVTKLFARRDRAFSRFRDDSELTRVNAFPSRIQIVSDDFADMVRIALDASAATGGLVDPTVGGAIVALGYDRDLDLIDPDGARARPVPAGRQGELHVHGRILQRPFGLMLDLNGVVKSRTVDDALELIGDRGFVSAGGDLATRDPLDVALPNGGAIRLESGGVATSGMLTRSWRRAGERLHHLVDPATGRPAESPWTCVTVAAATCLMADVAAKAAFLLGAEGPAWLKARNLPGRFLHVDGMVSVTEAWRRQVPAEAIEAA